jgi:hypothetical protein
MEVQPDFRNMLALLNKHGVEYVIVGSYALAHHGAPRNTGDIDLYVRPSPENAGRMVEALREFGFGSLGLAEADFIKPEQVIQLGRPPVRIDLLTSISGVSWEEADRGKAAGTYGEVPVSYLGRTQLTANKRSTGRAKDLADLEALGEGT